MNNLKKAPVLHVLRCIDALYQLGEIDDGEKMKLSELTKNASMTGDWSEVRMCLFGHREKSCAKKIIDVAIDVTR